MERFFKICTIIVIPFVLLIVFFQWAITSSYEEILLEEDDVEEAFVLNKSKSLIFPVSQKDAQGYKIVRLTENTLKVKVGNVEKVYLKDEFEVYRYLSTYYPKTYAKKKVAILYISTGKYIKFWEKFYEAMETYFLPHHEKTYFLFTDHDDLQVARNVVKVHQDQLPWPYITLKRFHFFDGVKDKLKEYDYIYFLNGTMLPVDFVMEEIFPTDEQEFMVTIHPGAWRKNKFYNTYDRNPQSKAYISESEGKYYVMGGFNGGTSRGFLKLIDTLKNWTDIDIKNKVMPRWHDESMLNRYYETQRQKGLKPLILMPEYAIPEIYKGWNIDELLPYVKMWILDKRNHGGHSFLRGVKVDNSNSDKKIKNIENVKFKKEDKLEKARKDVFNPIGDILDVKKSLDF